MRDPARPRENQICPFCPGNESHTPLAVLSYPGIQGGWRLRVIPNKYPAVTTVSGDTAYGVHEVIIESPLHTETLGALPEEAFVDSFRAFRERVVHLKANSRLQYVQLFKNHGAGAGASLQHCHSQLIGLPTVPVQVRIELSASAQFFAARGECYFCDLVRRESDEETRVVMETEDILVLEPYAPRLPFETWVLPKRHHSHFEAAAEAEVAALARAVRGVVRRLEALFDRPSLNFFLHSNPIQEPASPCYHWHLELIPRISGIGGFEWGTGFYINAIPPEEAASILRNAAD